MGPPLISGGNSGSIVDRLIVAGPASMGPPLISGGNSVGRRNANVLEGASMGPPLISGGNAPVIPVNAVLMNASMGPPLISGGNWCSGWVRPARSRRFNGAAADQRRKFVTHVDQQLADVASMGPPLISGGNKGQAGSEKADAGRFNGAAADQRRKSGSGCGGGGLRHGLQWGRR